MAVYDTFKGSITVTAKVIKIGTKVIKLGTKVIYNIISFTADISRYAGLKS